MTVLALDTCLGAVSVALLSRRNDGTSHLVERYEARDTGHAERIAPMLAEVMREAGAEFSELSTIAVTVGPGSFTGVRTGIAMARALALSTGRPVVGTTSLAVIAAEVFAESSPGRVVVAIDARRGELYCQGFDGSALRAEGPAIIGTPELLATQLADGALLIVGSGAPALVEAAQRAGKHAVAGSTQLQPHARHLALIATSLDRLDPVQPLYLRAPDAKPQSASILPKA